jgi:hypothetical protein
MDTKSKNKFWFVYSLFTLFGWIIINIFAITAFIKYLSSFNSYSELNEWLNEIRSIGRAGN